MRCVCVCTWPTPVTTTYSYEQTRTYNQVLGPGQGFGVHLKRLHQFGSGRAAGLQWVAGQWTSVSGSEWSNTTKHVSDESRWTVWQQEERGCLQKQKLQVWTCLHLFHCCSRKQQQHTPHIMHLFHIIGGALRSLFWRNSVWFIHLIHTSVRYICKIHLIIHLIHTYVRYIWFIHLYDSYIWFIHLYNTSDSYHLIHTIWFTHLIHTSNSYICTIHL